MSFSAMGIVLLAALLHAFWNFLVKSTGDKPLSMSAVVLGHTPFGLAALVFSPLPRLESLPYILGGAALHVGYQLFLLASYRIGDLSQVYPLARGSAPLIVAVVSAMLLGVKLSWLELTAVTVIGTGILSWTWACRSDGYRHGRAASLAIITGGFIVAYSLVDGMGARAAETALGFYGWLSAVNALIDALVMRVIQPGMVSRVVCQDWPLALRGGWRFVLGLRNGDMGFYSGTDPAGDRLARDKLRICAAVWRFCA